MTNLQLDRLVPAAIPRRRARAAAVWRLSPGAALAILIVVSTSLRLVWSALMGVCNDEAYHYLFTVYPSWSYFDHPPMTMWIEWLGLTACGGWVHPLSLRLGFVAMMAGSTWVMAQLTARWYGAWPGFFAALILNLTIYYGGAGGFALPDPALLFFGLLTIWALANAILADDQRTLPWVWVGLAFAGTLLSKYHAIFFPMGVFLYLVLTPSARRLLLRPGPYVALLIGSLGFAPVLIWNAQHDWLSFAFQASRAVGMQFKFSGTISTLLGPIVYLFPWTWLLLVCLLFHRLWNFRSAKSLDRLLVCLALPPMTFFLSVSCFKPMLPHWSLLGFVALLPLAGAKWAKWSCADAGWVRRRVAAMTAALLVVAGLALAQGQFGLFTFPFKDPLTEASGWDSVAVELKARGLLGQSKTFLFTDRWYDSGQLAFAVRNEVPILCYNHGDAHGFAQWHNPGDWVGWDGLLITPRDDRIAIIRLIPYFENVEFVAEFPMMRGDTPFRTIRVWLFTRQTRPFPFQYGTAKSADAR
jgi:Dolichyl-phosphate-mannose-protein mannosyltransferase